MVSQKFKNLKDPLRPITRGIGSRRYAVYAHLVSILTPLPSKNSSEFAQNIQQQSIHRLDVFQRQVSIYFRPCGCGPNRITRGRLQQHHNLIERTHMSVSNIMKLLDLVLDHNYFK